MKINEEIKKLRQMKKEEFLKEKDVVDKSHKMARYEVSSKKSQNISKINKYRKSNARILTILNQQVGEINGK